MSDWLSLAKKKLEKMPEDAKQIRETALSDLFFFAKLVNPGYMYGMYIRKSSYGCRNIHYSVLVRVRAVIN